jgi:glycosyltransferase involved in cell wall biosynthesis
MIIGNFLNSFEGGANLAGLRLHNGFLSLNQKSYVISSQKTLAYDHCIQAFHPSSAFLKLSQRYQLWAIRRNLRPAGSLASPVLYGRTNYRSLDLKCNIIHIVSSQRWLDIPSFLSSVPPSIPIVFTLHDFIPISGGCPYPFACSQYSSQCGSCPQLVNSSPSDISSSFWKIRKKSYINRKNLFLVANSQWTLAEAKRSSLYSCFRDITVIPNALDLSEYSPIPTRIARQALGIDNKTLIIGFSSSTLDDPRKGGEILINSLQPGHGINAPVTLLTMGKGSFPSSIGNIRVINIGQGSHYLIQRLFYSSLDLFVVPSIVETFGNTAMESIACGTPVLCFDDSGGLSTFVHDQVNGFLIKGEKSSSNLSAALSYILSRPLHLKSMRSLCNKYAQQSFCHLVYAQRYLDFFHRVIAACNAN